MANDWMAAILNGIIKNAEANQHLNDSDYTAPDDGLLYCGKCKTPKQCRVNILGEERVVPTICECEKKEQAEIERRRKEAEEMEIVRSLRSRSLMDDKFSSQTFDSFCPTKQNQKALRLMRRYADGFDEMLRRNQGLLLYGDVGTGKTFSAACIANALLDRRIPVVMTSFVKLLERVKGDDEDKLIRQLNQAKLLIIDDLGAERGSDYTLERVYDIVDSRYRSNLPMVLTTNLDLEEMKTEIDIRRSRIYDRIFEVCYPVKFTGISFRKAEAHKRFEEMRSFLEGDS